MARSPRRLLVVSHVMHYRHDGQLFAYGPYSREIDIWADLFEQVVIASPCCDEAPPGDCLAFTRSNIAIAPQAETGGATRAAKVEQLRQLPRLWRSLRRAMRRADAVHVRCPGNLGLLGVVMAPLFSRYLVAKYAGQWNGYEGESRTVRLQRRLLASRWWRGPVTVYGQWPDQPPHVIGFFTSMMTAQQVEHAAEVARDKEVKAPLRVFFSGVLESRKRADVLLDAVHQARANGLALEVVLAGDGSERDNLRRQAQELGLDDIVKFAGALPFEEALTWYEWAHCLVLPSQHSEGWPKVVAEAMCYGCVAIAVDHGHVPAMLEGRGVVLPQGSSQEIAAALRAIADDPARFQPMMRAASHWARQYSLEGLRGALSELLTREWGVPVPASTRDEFQAATTRPPDATSTRSLENNGAMPARDEADGSASTRDAATREYSQPEKAS